MKYLVAVLLALSGSYATQKADTFIGVIADDTCAKTGHAAMRMAPTDTECVVACVSVHGDAYVLVDDRAIYRLSDSRLAEKFAARHVTVIGRLNTGTNTIEVTSMTEAK